MEKKINSIVNPGLPVDIEQIILKSIKNTVQSNKKLDESVVVTPKIYKQVSELSSQKTKDTHVELYKNYVSKANEVSTQLDTVSRAEANSDYSEYKSLKCAEASNFNSVWLHELFFANCFDPHSEVYMNSISYMRLERDFGTFEDWQKDFVACGTAVGNGWVVCGYSMFLKRYVNTYVTDNSQDVLMGLYPVLVVDMHPHAYYRDYLDDKHSYLISRMREIDWNIVGERVLKAEAIHEVLK